MIWRLVTFGDYLPNTARAKGQRLPSSRPSIGQRSWSPTSAGSPLWSARRRSACAGARRTHRHRVSVLLVPLGLAVVSYIVLQPDWMTQYRFATPVWPLAALAVALAARNARYPHNPWPVVGMHRRCLVAALTLNGFASAARDFQRLRPPVCAISRKIPVTSLTVTPTSSACATDPCWRSTEAEHP